MPPLLSLLVIAVACFDAIALYARRKGGPIRWLAGDRVDRPNAPEKFYRDRALPLAAVLAGLGLALLSGAAPLGFVPIEAYCGVSVAVFTGNYLYERRLRQNGDPRY